MQESKKLFINVIIITGISLLIRSIAVSFQVFLSNRIGSAGIGLFQLISSVHLLAVTLATSGIRLTTTRLVSEEIGLGRQGKAVKYCFLYAVFFGVLAATVLYSGAEFIGCVWIGDKRSILSLRILALTLPLISMSSVISGYFIAERKAIRSSSSMLVEQLVKIGVIVIIIAKVASTDIERSCAAVVIGAVAGEFASFLVLLTLFLLKKKKGRFDKTAYPPPLATIRKMLSISLPLAVSVYTRCALSTLEHMLVPRCFKRSGLTAETALSDYGMIHGMVFPIITFPLSFFIVYGELVIPELTRAQVQRDKDRIGLIVGRSLRLCLFFSVLVSVFLFIFSGQLGMLLYSSEKAGRYIRLFAPLMTIMYMDVVTDGLLKGLGEHLASMRYNIADAIISIILVYTLIPKYAVAAYVGIIYFTECFNFALSIHRLSKAVPSKPVSSPLDDVRWLRTLFR